MPICKICKSKFIPKYSTLQKYCSNIDCKVAWAIQETKKIKDKEEKNKKIAWNKEKEKIRINVANWKNLLQDDINKIARLIDSGLLCLARNKAGQIHGGHIFSRGSNSTIRFNLHNIHRQNAQSNHFQNDDGLLREGLINEYGQEYMDFISELRRTPSLCYKNKDYHEFTLKARKIVSDLEKLNLTYSLENRILLRNKINLSLGIYEEEYCVFNILLKKQKNQ